MTIEIYSIRPGDVDPASEAGFCAANLLIAQGVEAGTAWAVGRQAGEYAVLVAFTALRDMGVIPEEGFDVTGFKEVAKRITDASINLH
jgi:hypothetical protein